MPLDPDLVYGATFAMVKALLPHRRFSADSKPTEADVETYILSVAMDLGADLGELPVDEAMAARLSGLALRAVTLGAAAHAEAAGMPERARPNEVSSYATWLWARYEEAFARAVAFAGDLDPGDGPVDFLEDEPAWSFPDPAAFAARGI